MKRRPSQRLYREARAILAVAAATTGTRAPHYMVIAESLGFSAKAVGLADKIWNEANGPEDWSPHTEDAALELVRDYVDMGDL